MPYRPVPSHQALCAAIALSLLPACKTAEQIMVEKVEALREREAWDQALGYLEGWLQKHRSSLTGWRYRVLLQLDKTERAQAAAEYARLAEALARHEGSVLSEVVLGAGGRWLVGDYRALARCAGSGIADAAFFASILDPKHLSEGSLTKVAVPLDEIQAVVEALPGNLDASATFPILERARIGATPALAARILDAAARHLRAGLTGPARDRANLWIVEGARSDDRDLREAAIRASTSIPAGAGSSDLLADVVAAFLSTGDQARALALVVAGPGGGGLTAWEGRHLVKWAESHPGALRTVAVAALASQGGRPEQIQLVEQSAAAPQPSMRFAAAVARALLPNARLPSPDELWTRLSAAERRELAPAAARVGGPQREAWTRLVLLDSDSLTSQAGATALAVAGVGDDPAIDPHLGKLLSSPDAASRAAGAHAAVVRNAQSLALPVAGLFTQAEDRVLVAALRGLLESGSPAFHGLIGAGLAAELPLVREMAVDAAGASCLDADQERLTALLTDPDPHIAVRAATALYLLVGQNP